METTERVVESYVRYVKGWATIPNIRCPRQLEIDLLAIDPVNGQRYHIETSVSISSGFSKLTDSVHPRDRGQEAQPGRYWRGGHGPMKTLEIDQATAPLAEYARDLENDPVILTRGGNPVAALMSLENVDWETISLSTNPKFIALIERVRAQQAAQGGYSSEEVRQMFGVRKQE